MSEEALILQFESEAAFLAALDGAHSAHARVLDAFGPYLPDDAAGGSSDDGRAIAIAVAAGGFVTAAVFYVLEWWTASAGYPFDSGGRPLNSWPTFVLGPLEFGVFAAGFAGVVTWLVRCGLPAPWHPAFDIEHIERATQDRFLLALKPGMGAEALLARLQADGVKVSRLKAAQL